MNQFEPNWVQCIDLASILDVFVNEICHSYSLFVGKHKSKKYAKLVTTIISKTLNQFETNWDNALIFPVSWMNLLTKYDVLIVYLQDRIKAKYLKNCFPRQRPDFSTNSKGVRKMH